jgi:hypothetical protein
MKVNFQQEVRAVEGGKKSRGKSKLWGIKLFISMTSIQFGNHGDHNSKKALLLSFNCPL